MTVSLQQAYSLLLSGKISLLHYKVYASLSRLGYKVFKHESCQVTDYEKKIKLLTSKSVARIDESEAVKSDTGMVVDEVNEEMEGNYYQFIIQWLCKILKVHLILTKETNKHKVV